MIILALIIGVTVPFLIFYQVSNGSELSRSLIKIFAPTFFVLAALRTVFILKTIEISDTKVWKIRYAFPRRELVFSVADIEYIDKTNSISYKYRIPVSMITIKLNNSRRIKISSNEMDDFEKLERLLNRKEYKTLKK